MRRTGVGGSWTAPGEDNIETRLWEEPHSTYLQAACCLVWLGEGDDDDGGEDEEPDQVGGGEEDGWDDAGVGKNQTESLRITQLTSRRCPLTIVCCKGWAPASSDWREIHLKWSIEKCCHRHCLLIGDQLSVWVSLLETSQLSSVLVVTNTALIFYQYITYYSHTLQ